MIENPGGQGTPPPDFRTYLVTSVCLASFWILAAWFITDDYRCRQATAVVAAEAKNAEHLGQSVALGVEHILSLRKGIAVTLANVELIRQFTVAWGTRKAAAWPAGRAGTGRGSADGINGFLAR